MSEIHHLDVRRRIHLDASREAVWDAVTGDLTPWWGSPYLVLEKPPPTVLHLEPRIGGLVVESNSDGDALWGTVTEVRPGRLVEWTGAQGLGGAATGTVRIELVEAPDGTDLVLRHESIGAFGDGAEAGYEHGWDDLLQRLRCLIEEGCRYGIAGENREPDGFEHVAR